MDFSEPNYSLPDNMSNYLQSSFLYKFCNYLKTRFSGDSIADEVTNYLAKLLFILCGYMRQFTVFKIYPERIIITDILVKALHFWSNTIGPKKNLACPKKILSNKGLVQYITGPMLIWANINLVHYVFGPI